MLVLKSLLFSMSVFIMWCNIQTVQNPFRQRLELVNKTRRGSSLDVNVYRLNMWDTGIDRKHLSWQQKWVGRFLRDAISDNYWKRRKFPESGNASCLAMLLKWKLQIKLTLVWLGCSLFKFTNFLGFELPSFWKFWQILLFNEVDLNYKNLHYASVLIKLLLHFKQK